MTITELLKELSEHEFKTDVFGYNIEDVNNFIENLANNLYAYDLDSQNQIVYTEKLQNELDILKNENDSLKFEIKKYRELLRELTSEKK
ncbi:hypothetical protein [Mycoplasma crocodyli]|uniref:DivIVA domain-containing protein n=1 Tax=Mycoplasma crocodyli (strain ATCC 51981 / MP145) TaxID=512564 RepID=D5E4Q6_MYCCM|nr:hypothetical protein [Mycoplasma crocodyli]ADE20000.1 hypothetical protein MCRO_0067 [Mycoplasma crocodyli MP145]